MSQENKRLIRVKTAWALFAIALFIPSACRAQGGEIKALIIGNDSYSEAAMFPSLRGTPHRDAEAVEDALRSAGVPKRNIVTLHDLDYKRFEEAVYSFRQNLSSEDSAIFYYSGHGFSIDDHAFLVPVDLRLGSTRRSVQRESISLDQIKKDLSKARMRAFIIDACRTNIPLLKQAFGSKQGLSLENLYDTKPAGTGELIVFATQGGKPAIADAPADGLSFFTYYFVKQFETNLPDLGTMAHKAQIATAISSNHSQEPDVRDNLQGYLELAVHPDSKVPSILQSVRSPTSIIPNAISNDDVTLPLSCPSNDELFGAWQLADNQSMPWNQSLIPNVTALAVSPGYKMSPVEKLPIPVNPIILSTIIDPWVILDKDIVAEIRTLFLEIDASLKPSEPLRGPNGPVNVRRSYRFISHDFIHDPSELFVSYEIFAGSASIKSGLFRIAVKELSPPMQHLTFRLDQMGKSAIDSACKTAVEKITVAPQ